MSSYTYLQHAGDWLAMAGGLLMLVGAFQMWRSRRSLRGPLTPGLQIAFALGGVSGLCNLPCRMAGGTNVWILCGEVFFIVLMVGLAGHSFVQSRHRGRAL